MFHNSELVLKTIGRKDILLLVTGGYSMAIIAAFLSKNPICLISVNCLFLFFFYHSFQRSTERGETMGTTFMTNAGGDLLLEQQTADVRLGKLCGSQWCSRYLAVLRYKAAGRIGHLVILKVQQQPEQFRQLSVWLRHNSHNEGKLES